MEDAEPEGRDETLHGHCGEGEWEGELLAAVADQPHQKGTKKASASRRLILFWVWHE